MHVQVSVKKLSMTVVISKQFFAFIDPCQKCQIFFICTAIFSKLTEAGIWSVGYL